MNKFKISFLTVVFSFSTVFMPLAVWAEHNDSHTIEQLRAQVAVLQEAINVLLNVAKSEAPELVFEERPSRPLFRGISGEDVTELQEFLSQFSDIYPEGLITGLFGELTERAVKKFQESNGLEVVGIVGPKTRALFGAASLIECVSSSERPCFDKQSGKKIITLNPNAGKNSFAACLKSAAKNNITETTVKTSVC